MDYWYWLALGFLLMAVELVAPSFFFMWLGSSALAVAVLTMIFPDITFTVQGALFAIAGVISFYVSRTYFKGKQHGFAITNLNKRGAQLIGQVVVLESAIEHGSGKAFVQDTLWSVTGADTPAGAKVKITAVNGTVLTVEAV